MNRYQKGGIYIFPFFGNKNSVIDMMNTYGNTIMEFKKELLYDCSWSGDFYQKNGRNHIIQNHNIHDTSINLAIMNNTKPKLGEILLQKKELDIDLYLDRVYIPDNMPKIWDYNLDVTRIHKYDYRLEGILDK